MIQIMQFFEATFEPLVFLFTVSGKSAMGLQARMPEVIATFKNKKAMLLVFVWGFVLGPALGLLLVTVLHLAANYAAALYLFSLAPCAPFVQVMVNKARGDISFAAALVPIVAAGTVILMPLIAPLFIKGLTVSAWDLAKVLLIFVLTPLTIGAALRHYAGTAATKIFPAVNVIAKITTVVLPIWVIVLYWREMLDTAGSFALLSMLIFMVVMGLVSYRFGFGLKQDQRSVMSLAMLTRNGTPTLMAALTIPNIPPGSITYIIMFGLMSVPISFIAARILGKQALGTVEGSAA